MVVRAAALVLAHWRGVWNQASRESGQGAKIGGAIVAGVVVVFLLPIAVIMFNIARSTGQSLAESNDARVLAFWAGVQTLFVVIFPLAGAFRVKPAFPLSRFGRFPATRTELLLAEIPASMLEAFPILGIGGIVVTNAGLAVAMPRLMPAVAIVAMTSVCWFVATMFIGSAVLALAGKARGLSAVAICAAFALAVWAGTAGMKRVFGLIKLAVDEWFPRFVAILPLTRAYEGILQLQRGAMRAGLTPVAFYVATTAVLLLVAVPLHSRRLEAQSEPSPWRMTSLPPLRFGTPAAGIGAVYFRQLLASSVGRTGVAVTVFMSGSIAIVMGIFRFAASQRSQFPPDLLRTIQRAEAAPWFGIYPLFVVVFIGSQIWINQFGFDAGSLRGLLALPVSARQILLGKAIGLAKYFAVSLGAGMLPILAFAPPTLRDAISGTAIAVLATAFIAAIGQALSTRFPRSFAAAGSPNTLPLYLSWIPLALFIVLGSAVFVLTVVGDVVIGGAAPILLVAAAIASCTLYWLFLPRLAEWMMEQRDRLVTM